MQSKNEKVQIYYDILSYLTEYPESQDTFDGIMHWWLLDREIKKRTLTVKEVLSELIQKDFINACKGPDSRVHYQINRDKYEEILCLLKQLESQTTI
jgi:hypothetical protein